MPLFPAPLIPWIEMRFLDADGNPLSGGKLYSYVVGTTTPQATYTDAGLTTAHTNPIVLDVYGRPSSPIYLAANGYKFILKNADDVTQYTIDDVENIGQVFAERFGYVMAQGSKNVTSGYVVDEADRLVTVNSAGGADPCVITLPAAADSLQSVTIKNLGNVELAITPDGTDTIDTLAAAFTVPAAADPTYPTVTLYSDGVSGWYVVSSHGL